jgi:hypothetical protein
MNPVPLRFSLNHKVCHIVILSSMRHRPAHLPGYRSATGTSLLRGTDIFIYLYIKGHQAFICPGVSMTRCAPSALYTRLENAPSQQRGTLLVPAMAMGTQGTVCPPCNPHCCQLRRPGLKGA